MAAGRDAPRRRWPGAVVGVTVVLVLVGWATDRLLAQREVSALLAEAASAQATVAYADRRIGATLTYTSPLLTSAAVSPGVRASLEGLVEDEARARLPSVQAARTRVGRARLLPWHAANRTARSAYNHYLDARLAYLSEAAADLAAVYRPHPELSRLLAAATEAFVVAAGPGSRPRVGAALG